MSLIGRYLNAALRFWRQGRDEDLRWRLSRQNEVARLRQARAEAEQAVVTDLKLKAQRLAHELAVNEAKNQNELAMVKVRCQQDLKDYQQYLQALDALKDSLRRSYSHLPEAVAFTIHHHAKQLLNRMWEAGDEQLRLKAEMQLLHFMTAVHEDSRQALEATQDEALPRKTLAMLDAGEADA